jgi:hypothetical protein
MSVLVVVLAIVAICIVDAAAYYRGRRVGRRVGYVEGWRDGRGDERRASGAQMRAVFRDFADFAGRDVESKTVPVDLEDLAKKGTAS